MGTITPADTIKQWDANIYTYNHRACDHSQCRLLVTGAVFSDSDTGVVLSLVMCFLKRQTIIMKTKHSLILIYTKKFVCKHKIKILCVYIWNKVLGRANYEQVFFSTYMNFWPDTENSWGVQGSFVMWDCHTCQDSSPVNLSTKSTSGTSQAPPSVLTENGWQSALLEMQTWTAQFQNQSKVSRQNESGVPTSCSFWMPRETLWAGILVPVCQMKKQKTLDNHWAKRAAPGAPPYFSSKSPI